ncbi:MAG: hypothetical protein JWO88_327, partial [Frankiales bacterium]|nr:hypothetical protein [Frankiales bacterium]
MPFTPGRRSVDHHSTLFSVVAVILCRRAGW